MNPRLDIDIVTEFKPTIESMPSRSGWGDRAYRTQVYGRAIQIEASHGKDTKFTIRILENGDLIITNHAGAYHTYLDSNIRLVNSRAWKCKK